MAPATSRRQRRRIPQRGFPLRLRFSRWGRANETRHCLSRNTKYEKTEGIDPVTAAIAEREGDLDLWANRFFLPFLRSQNEEREKNGKRYSRLTSPFDCKGGRGRERGWGKRGLQHGMSAEDRSSQNTGNAILILDEDQWQAKQCLDVICRLPPKGLL